MIAMLRMFAIESDRLRAVKMRREDRRAKSRYCWVRGLARQVRIPVGGMARRQSMLRAPTARPAPRRSGSARARLDAWLLRAFSPPDVGRQFRVRTSTKKIADDL
jgi:hypothetical protein